MTDRMSSAWRISQIATTVYLFFAFSQYLATIIYDRDFAYPFFFLLGILGTSVIFSFSNLKGSYPLLLSFLSLLFSGVCGFFVFQISDDLFFGRVNFETFPYQFFPDVSQYAFKNAVFSVEEIAPYLTAIVLLNLLGALILLTDILVKLSAVMAAWKDHVESKIALAKIKREWAAQQAHQEQKIAAEKERLAQEKARREKLRQDHVAGILSQQTAQLSEKSIEKNVTVNLDDDIEKFLRGNS